MDGFGYTEQLRRSITFSIGEAKRLNHEYVGTEHLLLGIIKEGESDALEIIENLRGDPRRIRQGIEEVAKPGKDAIVRDDLPFTNRAKKVLEFAMDEARELNHSWLGCEHLLLGLAKERNGIAGQVLLESIQTGEIEPLDAIRMEIRRLNGQT